MNLEAMVSADGGPEDDDGIRFPHDNFVHLYVLNLV